MPVRWHMPWPPQEFTLNRVHEDVITRFAGRRERFAWQLFCAADGSLPGLRERYALRNRVVKSNLDRFICVEDTDSHVPDKLEHVVLLPLISRRTPV